MPGDGTQENHLPVAVGSAQSFLCYVREYRHLTLVRRLHKMHVGCQKAIKTGPRSDCALWQNYCTSVLRNAPRSKARRSAGT
jgi:hypothetical protein